MQVTPSFALAGFRYLSLRYGSQLLSPLTFGTSAVTPTRRYLTTEAQRTLRFSFLVLLCALCASAVNNALGRAITAYYLLLIFFQ